MKRLTILTLGAVFAAALASAVAADDAVAPAGNGAALGPGAGYVDDDGDGVCDTCTGTRQGSGPRGQAQGNGTKAGGKGPGDGTGNQGVGPRDGSGFGAASGARTGGSVCDGSGPKGQGGRRGGRR